MNNEKLTMNNEVEMKNMPRIFINEKLEVGKHVTISKEQLHYLTKVMRTDQCLVFNNGAEFRAELKQETSKKTEQYSLLIVSSTERPDPSNNLVLAFAPIKQARLEEMANMATQMGVARLQPVVTERTAARHINFERIRKITIEASEQSGRNSIPEILPEMKFADFIKNTKNIVFADERFAHDGRDASPRRPLNTGRAGSASLPKTVLIGPEGGFSEKEFESLDSAGAVGISLGKTILRAETAAVVAIAKLDTR
jgi:16S rRNA (uracil1498-N3)-methyltransferase